MDLRQIRYFVAVAEEMSFRRAAERLHISQPPLSVHVQKLEAEIGVQLFLRDRKRISLTAAGSELLHLGRALLTAERKLITDVRRAADGESGRLSIGCSDDFLHAELPELVTTLMRRHPRVRVETRVDMSENLAAAALDGSLDIVLICPPLPDRFARLSALPLPSAPIVALLPASHALTQNESLQLRDLKDERFIAPAGFHATGFYLQMLTLFDEAGFVPHIVHESGSVEATALLVARGQGVALASAPSVSPALGGLAIRPLRDKRAHVKRAALWRADARALVEEVAGLLSDMEWLSDGS